MTELTTARVPSIVRLRWRSRVRIWWQRRKLRRLLGPEGMRRLAELEADFDRRMLGL